MEDIQTSQFIPIDKISLATRQPRMYFDEEALLSLQQSIASKGILHPLLVRPLGDESYILVSGERRFRAALNLRLLDVPVIIKDMTSLEAQEFALIENLQREDLNPVEETNAILDLFTIKLNCSQSEVKSLLYRMRNQTKRKSRDNVVSSKVESSDKTVLDVFNSIGKISLDSFLAHRLPLLKLPSEILDAIAQGKISYTKGLEITKVKDISARTELLMEAIANNLSLTQIKERVRARARVSPDDSVSEFAKIQLQYKSISRKLKLIADYPDVQLRLVALLDEVHNLLAG